MCADCHSTNLRKGYDEAANRFETTWSEIERRLRGVPRARLEPRRVGAEGGRLEAPRRAGRGLAVALDERRGVAWAMDAETGNASRSRRARRRARSRPAPAATRAAARSADEYVHGRPLARHASSWRSLEDGLYWRRRPDARRGLQLRLVPAEQDVRDGRDLQRLPRAALAEAARAGQRRLRAVPPAVEVRRAGAPSPRRPGRRARRASACHMPTTTYMVVDPRHDHSMRIPRPDLSVEARHARMPATNCHATGRRNGRPTRCRTGTDARPAATRRSAKPSPQRCATPRTRGRSS